MRIRKFVALVGAVTIFIGCLFFYSLTDHTLYLQDDSTHQFKSVSENLLIVIQK